QRPAAVESTAGITLKRIMAHPDWLGNAPEDPYWGADSNTVYYVQKRRGEIHRDLWRIRLDRGVPERVADEELGLADADGGSLSPDRRHKLFARQGDLFLQDLESGAIRQLTRTTEVERAPRFMADGSAITFQRGAATLVRELDGGLEYQPVELRLEDDPAAEKEPEDYLSRQQLRLFSILRQRRQEERDERQRRLELQAADPSRVEPPFYLGDTIELQRQVLSPTGDRMLLVVADKGRDEGRRDRMPSYVTEDGYVATREVRPKVGTGDPADDKLWLLDLETHQRHELDLGVLPGITVDPLAELRAAAKARQKAAARSDGDGDGEGEGGEGDGDGEGGEGDGEAGGGETAEPARPRPVAIGAVRWNAGGSRAAVQLFSADHKDRWLALVEGDGLRPIHRLQDDEGWINWSFNDFGWLRDGRRLWLLSEESGWSQLYLIDVESGDRRRLTDGDYVVDDVELSPDETYAYFTANREHPGIYETYRVPLAGGAVERLTQLGGVSRSRLSPDGRKLLILSSATTRPPELFLQEARPGAEALRLTFTVSDEFSALPWTAPEIVEVPSSHVERPIYARLYTPPPGVASPLPSGKWPAVIFIHGAGYLQNAHFGWSGYFREFMFHSLLTRAGYVVLDMDYRASRGYGRAWRTAIYRRMGTPEVEDLADGVAYLVERHGVERQRIGVYGGSYGGFLTFMAMFKRPELFACGAALRPVTDWAHYNHPYTSNILNTPDVDPEAYERSSPIEFAAGLERPLLICSGMQDDNVFFQDTVRLVQRLIELEKEDFETAFYPLEPHGFREPSSWLDEYRRIFKLFERHLKP
ncbi:MAG: S9 family peptidase, partial [Acidobacteria bacterium]